MSLLGYNPTGNVWPGELGVSRLDAPSEVYKLDPTLPVIGIDPKFDSDQVVIGRGRLVGLKGTADTSSGISQTPPGSAHETVLTVADGVNVAPVGFAPYNMFKRWEERLPGNRPVFERNHMIAVPYVKAINETYGVLTQGDKITALSCTDPRRKGAIVKWIPKTFVMLAIVGADPAAVLSCPANLPVTALAVFSAAGALSDATTEGVVFAANDDGFWTVAATNSCTVLLEYGQDAGMCAGEVYGIETNSDVPGFLKWVGDGFGAWDMPPMYAPADSELVQATEFASFVGAGAFKLEATDVKLDPQKPIDVYAAGDVWLQDVDGTWAAYTTGDLLPKATFSGADQTQGKNYTVNPFTGVVQFFGVSTSDPATSITALDIDDTVLFSINYYRDLIRGNPVYGTGQLGYSDGLGIDGIPAGTPPQFAVDGSIGILRVAIH